MLLAPHDCIVSRDFLHFLLIVQKKVAKKRTRELGRFLLRKTASATSLQPDNLLRKSALRLCHRYRLQFRDFDHGISAGPKGC
jgi:hypothetical protein